MWLIVEVRLIGIFASRLDWLVILFHVADQPIRFIHRALPLPKVQWAGPSAGFPIKWVRLNIGLGILPLLHVRGNEMQEKKLENKDLKSGRRR